ncbi:hypothetical protein A2U01_0096878, partial [Trifolium medium]|nr:hypothetical protein [Trifolium medium]
GNWSLSDLVASARQTSPGTLLRLLVVATAR